MARGGHNLTRDLDRLSWGPRSGTRFSGPEGQMGIGCAINSQHSMGAGGPYTSTRWIQSATDPKRTWRRLRLGPILLRPLIGWQTWGLSTRGQPAPEDEPPPWLAVIWPSMAV